MIRGVSQGEPKAVFFGNAINNFGVGELQFDVTMARLKNEYGVDAVYEPVDYATARW